MTATMEGLTDRAYKRESVLKGAQIMFGASVVDCVVVNISGGGARVRTGSVVPVPEHVVLRMNGGVMQPAQRRWTMGTLIGFQFTTAPALDEDSVDFAHAACDILNTRGLSAALIMLRERRFFDDAELRDAAESAEEAKARFAALLKARAESGLGAMLT